LVTASPSDLGVTLLSDLVTALLSDLVTASPCDLGVTLLSDLVTASLNGSSVALLSDVD